MIVLYLIGLILLSLILVCLGIIVSFICAGLFDNNYDPNGIHNKEVLRQYLLKQKRKRQ